MKKIIFSAVSMVMISVGVMAQTSMNRMIVKTGDYSQKSYDIGRVQEISFDNVEGRVAADVEVLEVVGTNGLAVKVTQSEGCAGYRLSVMSKTMVDYYWNYPDMLEEAIKSDCPSTYNEDYERAALSGFSLEKGTDYCVVAVAYDRLGTACEFQKAKFTTETEPLVGNPTVEVTEVERTKTSFKLNFKPNSDVQSYYCVSAEKGQMETYYDMYAAWYGCKNMGDLIKAWGEETTTEKTIEWKEMAPGTAYEVYVQCLDKNGTYAPMIIKEVSTVGQGGTGAALCGITLGDYKLQDWGGQQLYSQFITFTPNDQASCYRYGVYTADVYDKEKTEIQNELKQDPPSPNTAYWFWYETMTTDFQINPGTSAVAITAAKNANSEWGEITEVRFTTATQNSPAKVQSVRRFNYRLPSMDVKRGVAPRVAKSQITLEAK